nr:uncharacterized protein LOC100177694 isoform X3 [Ciona intestinalis]|eukprot:XP_026692232.1 uncharacterized protein LOC100177694 isoform X3 [Ciona intestinalis]
MLKEMVEIINSLRQDIHNCWCFFCVILSHGTIGDRVYATDDHLGISENVIDPFLGSNCPDLIGKPKIFIIEACRGQNVEEAAETNPLLPQARSTIVPVKYSLPRTADVLICHPSSNGSIAYMGQFLSTLSAMLKQCVLARGPEDPVYCFMEILTLVNDRVAINSAAMQMSTTENSMRKKIVFHASTPASTIIEEPEFNKLKVTPIARNLPSSCNLKSQVFTKVKSKFKSQPVWLLQFQLPSGPCKVHSTGQTENCNETNIIALLPAIKATTGSVKKIETLFNAGLLFTAAQLQDGGWAYHCRVKLEIKLPPSVLPKDLEMLKQEVNELYREYDNQNQQLNKSIQVEEFQHAESSENIENTRFNPTDSQDNLFAGACSKQLPPSKCIGEGIQPEDGKMERQQDYFPLSGYNCNTITIVYTFKGGIQDKSHPAPGKTYNGCTETAYLPDNSEGQSVYRLLHKAFQEGFTFGVGMCETSKQYRVMFKDIPHKTNPTGGKERDGYPDTNYMTEVLDALRSYGITE